MATYTPINSQKLVACWDDTEPKNSNPIIEVGDFVRTSYSKKIWRVYSITGKPSKYMLEHTTGNSSEKTEVWEGSVKFFIKGNKLPKNCETFAEYDNLKGNMKMSTEKTLYEIKVGEVVSYGFKLATNSQGQWVMELKGSGDVIAVDKKNVTEVMPYTVAVKFHEGGQLYHYFDENRTVKKGDVIVVASMVTSMYSLAVVHDIDTKARSATKEISFLKNLGGAT